MKKLLNLVAAVLALNFLAAAGGVGYLIATHKLDKTKVAAIRDLLFAADPAATTQPSTQPVAQEVPVETPMSRLDQLIAASKPKTPGEENDAVAMTYDAHAALLQRRLAEVEAQRLQLQQAQADFAAAREKLLAQQKMLSQQEGEQAKLAGDSGFQKTLELYQTMPAKRTKAIFLSLGDDQVVRYLQAMEPRIAGGILKEFKTPDETVRAQAILEKMRRASSNPAPSTSAKAE